MGHKLSVVVQVDLDGHYVRLVVTGCVSETNQHALYPLIRKTRTMIPSAAVTIDLIAADHLEATAVDLLRWAAEHDEDTLPGSRPVAILTSTALVEQRPMAIPVTTPAGMPTRLPDRRMA